jgi:hypothetical protein
MRPAPVAVIKAPPRGELPHPRRPRLVRDVHGNGLCDLFLIFPDLPRPLRAAPRIRRRKRAHS